MKAAVWYGEDNLVVQEVPMPEIGEEEALLRVRAAGVCATDYHIISGKLKIGKAPNIQGHEICGEVVEIKSQRTDIQIGQLDLTDLEMVIIPGGLGGVASIRACQKAMDVLKFAWENGKFVAAICAGPTVLADLHITDGKNTTCYPGCESGMGAANTVPNAACVRDGKLITGTSAGCAVPFGLALVAALKGEETAKTVAEQIVIR